MESAARHGIAHVRAKFAVGGTAVHVGAARPEAEGVDGEVDEAVHAVGVVVLPLVETFLQFGLLRVALADGAFGQAIRVAVVHVDDVLAVGGEVGVDGGGDGGEDALLGGDGHAAEDAVVAAAQTLALVVGEVNVLRGDGDVDVARVDVGADAAHGMRHVVGGEVVPAERGLDDDEGLAVTDEHFHGDSRVALHGVGQIYDGSGDAVGQLVRMLGVDFFKHDCGGLWV